jgi:hypothetical protein
MQALPQRLDIPIGPPSSETWRPKVTPSSVPHSEHLISYFSPQTKEGAKNDIYISAISSMTIYRHTYQQEHLTKTHYVTQKI